MYVTNISFFNIGIPKVKPSFLVKWIDLEGVTNKKYDLVASQFKSFYF